MRSQNCSFEMAPSKVRSQNSSLKKSILEIVLWKNTKICQNSKNIYLKEPLKTEKNK